MNAPDVNLADLYRNSGWLRFVFDSLGRIMTVSGACLLWGLLQAGLFGLLCWQSGALLIEHRPGELNLLEDTTALAYFFLLPFCFFLLHLNLRLFRRYLQNLDQVLEASCPASAHADLVAEALRLLQAPHLGKTRILLIVLGLAVAVFSAVTNFWPDFFCCSRPSRRCTRRSITWTTDAGSWIDFFPPQRR
jgi:hypothetical protein